METQKDQNNIPSATSMSQETMFSDIVDIKPYEKSLKNARIWLYVISAIQVVFGVVQYAIADDKEIGLVVAIVEAGIGVLFFLFALWSYKKPATAFMTALVTFVVIHIGSAIIEPTQIYKGIILKILVIVALVKGFNNAREVEKLKEATGS